MTITNALRVVALLALQALVACNGSSSDLSATPSGPGGTQPILTGAEPFVTLQIEGQQNPEELFLKTADGFPVPSFAMNGMAYFVDTPWSATMAPVSVFRQAGDVTIQVSVEVQTPNTEPVPMPAVTEVTASEKEIILFTTTNRALGQQGAPITKVAIDLNRDGQAEYFGDYEPTITLPSTSFSGAPLILVGDSSGRWYKSIIELQGDRIDFERRVDLDITTPATNLTAFAYDGNTLALLDGPSKRVYIYDNDAQLVRTLDVSAALEPVDVALTSELTDQGSILVLDKAGAKIAYYHESSNYELRTDWGVNGFAMDADMVAPIDFVVWRQMGSSIDRIAVAREGASDLFLFKASSGDSLGVHPVTDSDGTPLVTPPLRSIELEGGSGFMAIDESQEVRLFKGNLRLQDFGGLSLMEGKLAELSSVIGQPEFLSQNSAGESIVTILSTVASGKRIQVVNLSLDVVGFVDYPSSASIPFAIQLQAAPGDMLLVPQGNTLEAHLAGRGRFSGGSPVESANEFLEAFRSGNIPAALRHVDSRDRVHAYRAMLDDVARSVVEAEMPSSIVVTRYPNDNAAILLGRHPKGGESSAVVAFERIRRGWPWRTRFSQ